MLNIQKLTFFYFTVIWVCYLLGYMTWLIFGICLAVYFGVMLYGIFYIGSGFYIKVTCRAKTVKNQIAISFDDGPDKIITPKILDLLKASGIKATFFIIGSKAVSETEIIQRILDEGHLIGNHSFAHNNWYGFWSTKKITDDLKMTHSLMETHFDKKLLYFRPPFGVTNPLIKKAVAKMKYTTIGWSLRSLDTMIKSENRLLKRLKRKLKPGQIVLFHDNLPQTLNILQDFISYTIENHYNILPLDELTGEKVYE